METITRQGPAERLQANQSYNLLRTLFFGAYFIHEVVLEPGKEEKALHLIALGVLFVAAKAADSQGNERLRNYFISRFVWVLLGATAATGTHATLMNYPMSTRRIMEIFMTVFTPAAFDTALSGIVIQHA